MKKEIKTSGAVAKPTKTPEQLEALRAKAEAKALRKEAFLENKATGRDYTRVKKTPHHVVLPAGEDSEYRQVPKLRTLNVKTRFASLTY